MFVLGFRKSKTYIFNISKGKVKILIVHFECTSIVLINETLFDL